MKKAKIAILFCLITAVFLIQLAGVCKAGEVEELTAAGWKVIRTRHLTILCHPDINMERVYRKVNIRFYGIALDKSYSASEKGSIERKLADKFDRIFQKVEKVLDMYPRDIDLRVKILKNQPQLNEEYEKVLGYYNKNEDISFYIHKFATIYTTEQAIRAAVLAHEIGHAVSDHYFMILPPAHIKELLAQYAERHLED